MPPPETSQLAAPQSAPTTASGWTSGIREAVPPARSMLTSGGTSDETTRRAGWSAVSPAPTLRPVASKVTTSAPERAPAGHHSRSSAVASTGRPRPTDRLHFSAAPSACGCTHRSTPDRSATCHRTTTPRRPRPWTSTRASSAEESVVAASMVGKRPVATRVSGRATVEQAPLLAATLSSVAFPTASSPAGGRTACPSCSAIQSPVAPHTTRPSPSRIALPPTGACSVSAPAKVVRSRSVAVTRAARRRCLTRRPNTSEPSLFRPDPEPERQRTPAWRLLQPLGMRAGAPDATRSRVSSSHSGLLTVESW